MTSLNLYDYSLANNIEIGVKGSHVQKGMLWRALDATDNLLEQGIDKIKQDVFGLEIGFNPFKKIQTIFKYSDLKYKTEPILEGKTGLKSLIGMKKLQGFKVLVDEFNNAPAGNVKSTEQPEIVKTIITTTTKTEIKQLRYISTSEIARNFKLHSREVITFMEQKGYIKEDKITEAGKLKGLVLKKYMGNEYIAYPENLDELKALKK